MQAARGVLMSWEKDSCGPLLKRANVATFFVELLADRMAWWLGVWRREGLPPIRDCWTACAHPVGVAVTARLADGREAQAQGVGTKRSVEQAAAQALLARLEDR